MARVSSQVPVGGKNSKLWSDRIGVRILPQKNRFRNADVEAVWRNIRDLIPRADADAAIQESVYRIEHLNTPLDGLVCAWSGGKDSLALQVVCEMAGVRRFMLAHRGELEWPDLTAWLMFNLPTPETVIIERPGYGWDWLATIGHRRMFPYTHAAAYWWTKLYARWGQEEYTRRYATDYMLMGRRTADNNVCGRGGVQSGSHGMVFNPMYDWSHEMTLAVVAHFYIDAKGKTLPPPYARGDWELGTGSWMGRTYPTKFKGWLGTWDVDPSIVRRAAQEGVPGAYGFLREIGQA